MALDKIILSTLGDACRSEYIIVISSNNDEWNAWYGTLKTLKGPYARAIRQIEVDKDEIGRFRIVQTDACGEGGSGTHLDWTLRMTLSIFQNEISIAGIILDENDLK